MDINMDNLAPLLLDLGFEPILIRDFYGGIVYWNRGAADFYGYSSEEAVGANSHELLKTIFSIPMEDYESQLNREGTWIGELIHTTKDGRKLIVESRHQIFEQGDGRQLVLETNRDITARETQYRTLFEGMQEGAAYCRMIHDAQGQAADWVFLDANPALEKILGISGLIGRKASELFPDLKQNTPTLYEMFERAVKTGIPGVFEGYVESLDKWAHVSAFSPARNHFIAIVSDISERKLTEKALARVRNQLKFFVKYMPAAVAMLDKDLRYLAHSQRWLDDYGLGPQELAGRHHYEIFPEILEKPDWQAVHQRALAGTVQRCEEDHFVRQDGTATWLKWEIRPWFDLGGEIGGILIFTEDITRRKQDELELQRVKERIEHLISTSPAVIYACKPEEDFATTFVSANVIEQLGYPPEAFIEDGNFWIDHVHPEDLERVLTELPRIFEVGQSSHEYRFLHKDGHYRWMLDELHVVRDKQGKPLEIVGAWNDITEKKLAEEELRESERNLRLALDASRMGLWDWNMATDRLWWDERECELFGIAPEEFTGYAAQPMSRIHPDDRESTQVAINKAVSGNETFQAEFRVIHPDGTIRWLAGRGQVVSNHGENTQHLIGVNFDITERKESERGRDKYIRMENMAQMHRLHIAGEFAALLAHQLNQPLTAIRSFAEAGLAQLRRDKLDPQTMQQGLKDIVAQSERAAGSIRDLRKFLARQPQELRKGDINAEVRAACSLMSVLARGRKIRIRQNLSENLPEVAMRTSQIEQIIVNLIENAMDAINHAHDEGGGIEISTRLDANSGQVIIGVTDSGPGLDDSTVSRVFDPLYTTKKNGIGMGLAISRSIIEDHGGRIWADIGPGGRFFFSLPC